MEREPRSPTRGVTLLDRDSKFVLRKIIIDFIILLCVGFPILFFFLWGKPYERGFFCDDESLKHPYKDSTVTNVMLYIVGLALPCTAMILTEFLRLRNYASRSRSVLGRDVPAWAWEAYRAVGVFLFGVACQQLTTDIAKYSIGRLRPHFFYVCQPDIDCSLEVNKWRYIEQFSCRGTDAKLLKEMRLSFPSGHSSFSAYTMLYFGMYLQKRVTWNGSKLLRHLIQLLLFLMTWYTMLTRVSDYKHHWSDVMAGFAIGTLYAVVIFTFVSDMRRSKRGVNGTAHYDSELRTTNGGARQV